MTGKLICILTILFIACTGDRSKPVTTQRIVSLAPNITEILFALELEDRVVAVSDYCYFPPQAKQKESVGGLFNPNLEKISSLQPDLILATKSSTFLNDKFSAKNIRVILLPEKTVEDVYISIDSIGVLTGKKSAAAILIQSIKDSLIQYRGEMNTNGPTAILVLGRSEGSTRNIGISGPGAFINELWEYSGGQNAFPDMPGSFTQVNREDLLIRDPHIIIEFKADNAQKIQNSTIKEEWHDLDISAVRNGNIFFISGVNMLVPGPRIYLLAKEYARILKSYR